MRIFTAKQLKVPSNLSDLHLLPPVCAATCAMLLINVLWLAMDPLEAVRLRAKHFPDIQSFSSCAGERVDVTCNRAVV